MIRKDPDWNPNAYRFDFPDVPAYEGPLMGMPLIHKVDKIRQYLDAVLKEACTSLSIGADLPALLTGLAAVDYLAGFYAGHQSKKDDYISFMRHYFPAIYQSFLECIYDNLRCGLMHNLVATNPWKGSEPSFLIVSNHSDHLGTVKHKTAFGVINFLEDVRRAWWKYAHDLVMKGDANPDMITRFLKRFNSLQGVGAFMVKLPDVQQNST